MLETWKTATKCNGFYPPQTSSRLNANLLNVSTSDSFVNPTKMPNVKMNKDFCSRSEANERELAVDTGVSGKLVTFSHQGALSFFKSPTVNFNINNQ